MRADLYLYIYENVKSRQQAKKLIDGQNVRIDGKAITKPSQEIDENIDHTVEILNQPRFVSRGGEKLDYALNSFEIDVIDMNCIDVGASTGGFTDCLLQRGAKSVYAVDSGHSQLDPCIEEDPRVVSIEKFNARFMEATDFPHAFDIAVMECYYKTPNKNSYESCAIDLAHLEEVLKGTNYKINYTPKLHFKEEEPYYMLEVIENDE